MAFVSEEIQTSPPQGIFFVKSPRHARPPHLLLTFMYLYIINKMDVYYYGSYEIEIKFRFFAVQSKSSELSWKRLTSAQIYSLHVISMLLIMGNRLDENRLDKSG